ncbi:pimeloyl-ACP methyl ester carboxylesterase [Nocardia transvalensis]|uniref:Pimeloyl-ACP methyl ester carboxylesterase n=1 Tax=Nocardia transvalensis TaxID=37333 RepID=A0A7W9PII2_9NOCA|nr:alpha/beta fold hydrolase [Nocardia transvalensis]MBB5916214.1 pimeloyl-ACP methyl ester carboxylesterase [Nocardia transvalensis]
MYTTTVQLSGGPATVAYDRTGSGPAVVLIHGTAADRTQWAALTAAIASRYTVVALDYSGSGETVDHGGPLTLADLAAEVRAVADHAGLGRFHLVGHSLGAAVAAQVAATDPARPYSLLMHAGWVRTDTRMDAEFRYWLDLLRADAEHGTTLFPHYLPLAALGPRYWDRVTEAENTALIAQLADAIAPGAARQTEVDRTVDLTGLLGRITAPSLVLASAHDRVIPADQQRQLLKAIPDARYAEIDAGHGAPAEDPDGFHAKITAFLDAQVTA